MVWSDSSVQLLSICEFRKMLKHLELVLSAFSLGTLSKQNGNATTKAVNTMKFIIINFLYNNLFNHIVSAAVITLLSGLLKFPIN